MNLTTVATSIFELLRRYNRKSRFSTSAFETDLSTTESHILIELDAFPDRNIAQLCEGLRIDKSTLSRALVALVNRKILTVVAVPNDRRQSRHSFTALGREYLERLDESANHYLAPFCDNLSHTELIELTACMRSLMDSEEAPPVQQRANDVPILVEMRRASRAWGFIGRSLLGSGLSAASWQLLSEIEQAEGRCSPSDLAEMFGLNPATISLNLSRLERDGLIRRTAMKADKRRVVIRLAPKGSALVRTVERAASKRISKAIGDRGSEYWARFTTLLAKYAGEQLDLEGRVLQFRATLNRVSGERELLAARMFLVERMVKERTHHLLSSRVIDPEHDNFTCSLDGEIVAVAELQMAGAEWRILHYAVDRERLTSADEGNFFGALQAIHPRARLVGQIDPHNPAR